jgi:uncharacterized membrane protein YedE/YeeE
VTALVLGLATGMVVGGVMARGRLCFNSGLREATFEGRDRVLRAFAVAIAAQLLVLPLLIAAGLDAGRIGFFPVAQLVGGLAFGAGMALAGGCIAGILWKSGAGSLATAIAIAGFVAGELLIRGPGERLVADLDEAGPRPASSTVYELLGAGYAPIAIAAGIAVLVLLLRRSRAGLDAGLALGAVAALAWVTAAAADHGYGLGFAGSAQGTVDALEAGAGLEGIPFPAWVAVGLVAGAGLAARGQLRLPDAARARRALAGGVIMGAGATLAHGCNIGNGLTGIPLLSLGSLWATAWMTLAALLTWRFVVAARPAIRGGERAAS